MSTETTPPNLKESLITLCQLCPNSMAIAGGATTGLIGSGFTFASLFLGLMGYKILLNEYTQAFPSPTSPIASGCGFLTLSLLALAGAATSFKTASLIVGATKKVGLTGATFMLATMPITGALLMRSEPANTIRLECAGPAQPNYANCTRKP